MIISATLVLNIVYFRLLLTLGCKNSILSVQELLKKIFCGTHIQKQIFAGLNAYQIFFKCLKDKLN